MRSWVSVRCPRQAGVSKSRPDVKRTSKLSASSQLWRRMENLVEHAYVARVGEPLFCPNCTVSTSTPLSLAQILASSVAGDLGTGSSIDDGIIFDNGNVACNTPDTDGPRLPENDRSLAAADIATGESPHSPLESWLPPNVLVPTVSDASVPDLSASGFGILSSIIPHNALTTGQISSDGTRIWQPTPYIFGEPQIASLAPGGLDLAHRMWHDESVAVDDHDRYDFANFLERWKAVKGHNPIRTTQTATRYSFESTRASTSSGFGDQGADDDIQGLDWRAMGLNRDEALRGRHLLHPARREQRKPAPGWGEYCASTDTKDPMYSFRQYNPHHRAQPSHCQLRNLVASTGRSSIFYGAGTVVKRTSLACPTEQDIVIDLSESAALPAGIRVTCLATMDGCGQEIVLAGGFNGEYAMSNLSLDHGNITQGYVSHAYNGVVTHISTGFERRSGRPQAVFTCNDQRVRVMDLETSRFTTSQTYHHPINCSALSSDCRLRLVVGDSNDALVVDADAGQVQANLKAHTDNIFACAWAPNGRHVATAAEDGKIVIWDSRSWKEPLHVRSACMSSARSLHFTDDGLLLAAEDDDVVTVHEPQHFEVEQSIRFFGSIAGVTLVDGGDEIVVGNADKTVGGLMSFRRMPGQARVDCYDDDMRLVYNHTQHSRLRYAEFDILP